MKRFKRSNLYWGIAITIINFIGFILSIRLLTMIPVESVDARKFIGFGFAVCCAWFILYGVALIISAVRK